MKHLTDDDLVLFAYDELDDAAATAAAAHLASCPQCHARLAPLERARVATGWALPPRRPLALRRVGLVAVAAAAVLAVVLWRGSPVSPQPRLAVTVPRYTAPELAPIDSLLTRLEQEKPYAIP